LALTEYRKFTTIITALSFCLYQGFKEILQRTMKKSPSIESYRKLVAMQAWKAWRRLPMQTRIWIDIEDMIEDGMRESWKLTKTYNPQWASFSTALFHRLHHFFINEYIEHHSAQQRGWERVNGNLRPIPHRSIQEMELYVKTKGSSIDDVVGQIPALVVSEDSILNNALTECFVVPALERVYQEASPKLQAAFIEWFLSLDKSRIHKKGKPFRKAAKEFRELCSCEGVVMEDCIHLVRSPSCLDTLSRDLFGVPRDLNFPTPVVERML
jgi:hypothetical protein